VLSEKSVVPLIFRSGKQGRFGLLLLWAKELVLLLKFSPLFLERMATISYDEAIAKYSDVQGNIIKGHGRDHAALLFVQFGDVLKAKIWIRSLLDGSAGVRLTSTATQINEMRRFKKFGIPGNLFANFLLTGAGIEFLGKAVPTEADQVGNAPVGPVFAEGMRTADARQRLRDPEPAAWEEGWFEVDPQTKQVTDKPTTMHALLLLADDDKEGVQHAVRHIQESLESQQITLLIVEWGHTLRNANGDGIEHFGYADGVSQPIYLTDDMPHHQPEGAKDNPLWEDIDRWDPGLHSAEELALLPDPLGNGGQAMGSFLVFRKLRQNVLEFKEAEERLAQRLGLLTGDEERAGAMLIGRFEDGTPLVERGSAGLIRPIVNNFNYDDDANGSRCPFHAHIRKTNPRGETKAQAERLHTLTRRGIPFGSVEDAQQEDGEPVGLLFMCFQRNIGQQFEFVQTAWANEPDFLFNQKKPGIDPIIGQPDKSLPPDKYRFNYTYGATGCRRAGFDQFVSLMGGEYFYAPSLSGLDNLAK
jgi:Dyp-type peroxidase family